MNKANEYKLLENKKVLIVGYGKSGIDSSLLAKRLGATVFVYDDRTNLVVNEEIVEKVYNDVESVDWNEINLTVVSPGVPVEKPVVKSSYSNKIDTIGEIEFAYRYSKGDILAVTGTNGKTTTVTLLGEIMKKHSENTIVVGNIGKPFTELCDRTNDETNIVAELSSYQLETIKEFKPRISAIVNITEDHLTRHKTMENYIDCKFNIALNQSEQDYIVLNLDDENIKEYILKNPLSADLEIIWFSISMSESEIKEEIEKVSTLRFDKLLKNEKFANSEERKEWKEKNKERILNPSYIYYKNKNIYYSELDQELVNGENIMLPGLHNVENIMVASIIAYKKDVEIKTINKVLRKFKGVEHRIEFVIEKEGIQYFNDSKGTNPDATIKAVKSMTRPTTILLGGSEKGTSFKPLAKELTKEIKNIIAYGESKEVIIKDFEYYNKKVIKVANMKEAIEKAIEITKSGENILLSPACASFDEYANFEERGRVFKEIVTNGDVK